MDLPESVADINGRSGELPERLVDLPEWSVEVPSKPRGCRETRVKPERITERYPPCLLAHAGLRTLDTGLKHRQPVA
jgi:hypothetical protein